MSFLILLNINLELHLFVPLKISFEWGGDEPLLSEIAVEGRYCFLKKWKRWLWVENII